MFDMLEDIDDRTLARINILSRLTEPGVAIVYTKGERRILIKRRTPIPAKITFAGENTCKIDIRTRIAEIWPLEIYETNTLTESSRKRV
jgi:hypothetical protein